MSQFQMLRYEAVLFKIQLGALRGAGGMGSPFHIPTLVTPLHGHE